MVAIALVALASLVIVARRASEPTHAGRPLSEWVADLRNPNPEVHKKASEAIRAMGPAAIEHLKNDLAAQPAFEEVRQKVRNQLPAKFRATAARVLGWKPAHEVRFNAAVALREVGPAASNAAPALVESLPLTMFEGIAALSQIGPSAVPALRAALTNENEDRRIYAMRALQEIGTNAVDATPDLIALLESGTQIHAAYASGALVRIGSAAVPGLTNALLTATNGFARATAAMTLQQMGPPAAVATNALAQAMNDPNPDVRLRSLQAIMHIARHEEFAAPIAARALSDPDHFVRRVALISLGFWEVSFRNHAEKVKLLLEDSEPDIQMRARELLDLHLSP